MRVMHIWNCYTCRQAGECISRDDVKVETRTWGYNSSNYKRNQRQLSTWKEQGYHAFKCRDVDPSKYACKKKDGTAQVSFQKPSWAVLLFTPICWNRGLFPHENPPGWNSFPTGLLLKLHELHVHHSISCVDSSNTVIQTSYMRVRKQLYTQPPPEPTYFNNDTVLQLVWCS